MGKADLHLHSTASDGKMLPEDVVRTAHQLGLSAISLTDHDTIEGIKPAQKTAREFDIEVIPGVEITTAFNDRESHLLAYNFDVTNAGLNTLLQEHKRARVQRARWIIGQLQKKGLDLDINEVLAEAGGRNVGRPHIAAILKKKGYIATAKEAFIRYLSDEALGTIQSNYVAIAEVIEIVKQAGGVTILAHPGRMYSERELLKFVEAGIDGLEMIHPSHNYDIQKEMEAFAGKRNLLTTGGSDFHGNKKSYYRHFGVLTVSIQCVDKIKLLSAHRKGVSV
ncbi:MAG: PHP domain-containing protein [Balneolaceae bacterium]|nr:PHP domain-containing protein [Balneolaceae bacterium]